MQQIKPLETRTFLVIFLTFQVFLVARRVFSPVCEVFFDALRVISPDLRVFIGAFKVFSAGRKVKRHALHP